MKELKKVEPIYIEEYDIHVNRYLTKAQIQNIANEVIKVETWAERESIIDYMLLNYATDISKKEIDAIDTDVLEHSGLMEEIRCRIINIYDMYEAIKFEESFTKQLGKLMTLLPTVAKEAVGRVKVLEKSE